MTDGGVDTGSLHYWADHLFVPNHWAPYCAKCSENVNIMAVLKTGPDATAELSQRSRLINCVKYMMVRLRQHQTAIQQGQPPGAELPPLEPSEVEEAAKELSMARTLRLEDLFLHSVDWLVQGIPLGSAILDGVPGSREEARQAVLALAAAVRERSWYEQAYRLAFLRPSQQAELQEGAPSAAGAGGAAAQAGPGLTAAAARAGARRRGATESNVNEVDLPYVVDERAVREVMASEQPASSVAVLQCVSVSREGSLSCPVQSGALLAGLLPPGWPQLAPGRATQVASPPAARTEASTGGKGGAAGSAAPAGGADRGGGGGLAPELAPYEVVLRASLEQAAVAALDDMTDAASVLSACASGRLPPWVRHVVCPHAEWIEFLPRHLWPYAGTGPGAWPADGSAGPSGGPAADVPLMHPVLWFRFTDYPEYNRRRPTPRARDRLRRVSRIVGRAAELLSGSAPAYGHGPGLTKLLEEIRTAADEFSVEGIGRDGAAGEGDGAAAGSRGGGGGADGIGSKLGAGSSGGAGSGGASGGDHDADGGSGGGVGSGFEGAAVAMEEANGGGDGDGADVGGEGGEGEPGEDEYLFGPVDDDEDEGEADEEAAGGGQGLGMAAAQGHAGEGDENDDDYQFGPDEDVVGRVYTAMSGLVVPVEDAADFAARLQEIITAARQLGPGLAVVAGVPIPEVALQEAQEHVDALMGALEELKALVQDKECDTYDENGYVVEEAVAAEKERMKAAWQGGASGASLPADEEAKMTKEAEKEVEARSFRELGKAAQAFLEQHAALLGPAGVKERRRQAGRLQADAAAAAAAAMAPAQTGAVETRNEQLLRRLPLEVPPPMGPPPAADPEAAAGDGGGAAGAPAPVSNGGDGGADAAAGGGGAAPVSPGFVQPLPGPHVALEPPPPEGWAAERLFDPSLQEDVDEGRVRLRWHHREGHRVVHLAAPLLLPVAANAVVFKAVRPENLMTLVGWDDHEQPNVDVQYVGLQGRVVRLPPGVQAAAVPR